MCLFFFRFVLRRWEDKQGLFSDISECSKSKVEVDLK